MNEVTAFLPRPSDRLQRHCRLRAIKPEETALDYNIRLLREYCYDVDEGLREIFVKLRGELSISTNPMSEESSQRTLSRAFRKLVNPGIFAISEEDRKKMKKYPNRPFPPEERSRYVEFCAKLDDDLFNAVLKDRQRPDKETPRGRNEDPGLEKVLDHLKSAVSQIELLGDLSRVAPLPVNRDDFFAKQTCDAHVGRAIMESRALKKKFVQAVWPIVKKINELDPTILGSEIVDKNDLDRTARFGGEVLLHLVPYRAKPATNTLKITA